MDEVVVSASRFEEKKKKSFRGKKVQAWFFGNKAFRFWGGVFVYLFQHYVV